MGGGPHYIRCEGFGSLFRVLSDISLLTLQVI